MTRNKIMTSTNLLKLGKPKISPNATSESQPTSSAHKHNNNKKLINNISY